MSPHYKPTHNPRTSTYVNIGHFAIEKFDSESPNQLSSTPKIRLHHAGEYQEFDADAFEEFLYKISNTSPLPKLPCLY